MSKKPKYKAHPDAMNPGFWFVESPRDIICQRCTWTGARKIARALNAMEDKPKAKAWKFDWSGVPAKYEFAAMDADKCWFGYVRNPSKREGDNDDLWVDGGNFMELIRSPYPGDWRDSLQKRP